MDEVEIAVRFTSLEARLTTLTDEIRELKECQGKLVAQANRWKGALVVVIALGGLFSAILTMLGRQWIE